MFFKSNKEKKTLFREIRAAEKELNRKKKLLRECQKRFMREPDPKKAKTLSVMFRPLALDILRDKQTIDEMIDKYNAM